MESNIKYGKILQTLARIEPSSEKETCECTMLLFGYGLQAKTILELGVHKGISTMIFLIACHQTNGHLYSVDIFECASTREVVKTLRLEKFWTFTVIDDIEYAKTWKMPIDVLFIDTSHLYEQTLAELKLYSPFLTEKGTILLHDTIGSPGVTQAAQKFIQENSEWALKELLPNSIYGLGELKKKGRILGEVADCEEVKGNASSASNPY